MTQFLIANVKKKARRMPAGYLSDCKALADTWDEDKGVATFSDAMLAEIRETWGTKKPNRKPCANCRGIR